jgi:hypothetical protein
MTKLRPILFAWLAFFLLFAQQGAATHALSHLTEHRPAQQEKQLPHSPACDKCVVYAGVGAGAASATATFELPSAGVEPGLLPAPAFRSETPSHYRSRAPPVLA